MVQNARLGVTGGNKGRGVAMNFGSSKLALVERILLRHFPGRFQQKQAQTPSPKACRGRGAVGNRRQRATGGGRGHGKVVPWITYIFFYIASKSMHLAILKKYRYKLQKPDLSSPIAIFLYQHFTYTRSLNNVQFYPENISDHAVTAPLPICSAKLSTAGPG
jgi:hypothetical protein